MPNNQMRTAPPAQTQALKSASQQEILLVFILLLLCIILYFSLLGARPLWDPDEGMHAATSKVMVQSGDWIATTFNGEPFYDKPPLHNWLVALSFLLFGFTEFAARLPAALLGTGCVFITYLFGRRMFGPTAGFLSGAILATSMEFLVLSRSVVHDISLLFFVTLALYLFYIGYGGAKNRKWVFPLFYLASGLAVLAKGPIGVLLPGAVIGLFLILRKEIGFLKEMSIGRGIPIFLVVAAPWYILIALRDPEYAAYFFIYKNLMTFFSEKPRHTQPFYYYFPVLVGGFFPWSCFLPYALIRSVGGRIRDLDPGKLFCLLWFAFIFVFFSISRTKLETYLLPLFPATALLVATLWQDLFEKPTKDLRRGFFYSILPWVLLFPMALIYILIYPPVELEAVVGLKMSHLFFLSLWLVGIILAAFVLFLVKYDRAFFGAVIIKVVFTIMFLIVVMLPTVNPYRTTKDMALKVDKILPPGDDLAFYDRLRGSAIFYTGRRGLLLHKPEDLAKYFAADKQRYCITHRKELEDLTVKFNIIDQQGDKLLISNKN